MNSSDQRSRILPHYEHQGRGKKKERVRPSANMLVCGVHVDSGPTSLLEEVLVPWHLVGQVANYLFPVNLE